MSLVGRSQEERIGEGSSQRVIGRGSAERILGKDCLFEQGELLHQHNHPID